jgi:hypothetical protein
MRGEFRMAAIDNRFPSIRTTVHGSLCESLLLVVVLSDR